MKCHMLKAATLSLIISSSLFAEGVEKGARAELVVDVTFVDGRTLTVHQAEIRQQMNTGYVPARYGVTDRVDLYKSTTSLGVTQTERKSLLAQRIRAIQYLKNELNWCVTLVSLADGAVLTLEEGKTPFTFEGPEFVLDRLSDENRQELGRLQLSKEFVGYKADTDGMELEGKVAENTFRAENLFDCPEVADDPGPSVRIKNIDLRWAN